MFTAALSANYWLKPLEWWKLFLPSPVIVAWNVIIYFVSAFVATSLGHITTLSSAECGYMIWYRVTTFVEFLETWKCQGNGTKSGKDQGFCVVRDISLWHHGIMPVMCMDTCSEHHITSVLYLCFNAFCISDVRRFELSLVSCWNAPQSL